MIGAARVGLPAIGKIPIPLSGNTRILAAMIRLVFADDHAIVRTGFRSLVEQVGGYEILAECTSADTAREAVIRFQPEVLVTDISMPGGGLNLAAELRQSHPALRILLYSQFTGDMYVSEAHRLGVAGYVSKDAIADELVMALEHIVKGGFYLSSDLRRPTPAAGLGQLSDREREVLMRLLQGQTPKQVALDLGISDKTAYAHREKVRSKLGVRNDRELQQMALSLGLV